MAAERKLDCPTHGAVAWKGHMMCAACGRVRVVRGSIADARDFCECGAPFRPRVSPEFTARPICPACADARLAAN